MSCLNTITIGDAFVNKTLPTDLVHADLLAQAVADDLPCAINRIIAVINGLTGDECKLKDGSVALRMFADEAREAIGGFSYFESVVAATTGNITLSGEQTIDGVVLTSGQKVLALAQTTSAENAIYTVATDAWVADTLETDGSYHVWVESGTVNGGSSFAMNPDKDSTAFVPFFVPLDQTLTSDQLDALAGTEGTPSATNVFVTDSDPRLVVFTDTTDGMVPAPGVTVTCSRFLCEDGTWSEPSFAEPDSGMFLGVNNVMTADGIITFPDVIGVKGLANPASDGDACNKAYADAIFVSVSATLSAHTSLTNNPHATSVANIQPYVVVRDGSGLSITAQTFHKQIAGGITSTLPAAPADGTFVRIANRGGASNTVDGNGKTIEGALTLSLLDGESVTMIYSDTDGDWSIV